MNLDEKKVWIVCSNDNNNGKGGWDYHKPELVNSSDYDKIYADRQYNSLADVDSFEAEKEALEFYNEMNLT